GLGQGVSGISGHARSASSPLPAVAFPGDDSQDAAEVGEALLELGPRGPRLVEREDVEDGLAVLGLGAPQPLVDGLDRNLQTRGDLTRWQAVRIAHLEHAGMVEGRLAGREPLQDQRPGLARDRLDERAVEDLRARRPLAGRRFAAERRFGRDPAAAATVGALDHQRDVAHDPEQERTEAARARRVDATERAVGLPDLHEDLLHAVVDLRVVERDAPARGEIALDDGAVAAREAL